jgi:hypothetical protein
MRVRDRLDPSLVEAGIFLAVLVYWCPKILGSRQRPPALEPTSTSAYEDRAGVGQVLLGQQYRPTCLEHREAPWTAHPPHELVASCIVTPGDGRFRFACSCSTVSV